MTSTEELTPSQSIIVDAVGTEAGPLIDGPDLSECPKLKDPTKLRPREKSRLLALANSLNAKLPQAVLTEGEEIPQDLLDVIADLDETLEPFAEDSEAWREFACSSKAYTHLPSLFAHYVAQMGESMRSAS